jgi:hypothetical protein
MSLMRPGYKELGIKLISLGEDHSYWPKWPSMEDEKRYDQARDPINFLLKESLA